jgi:hypothetical protein
MNIPENLVLPVLPLSVSFERSLRIKYHGLATIYKLFQIFLEINRKKYVFLDERNGILGTPKAL